MIKKDIKGYEGLYYATSYGNIVSYPNRANGLKHTTLRPTTNNAGYLHVSLSKNNIRKTKNVHKLIADTLLENIDGKPHINHKDGDKLNNELSNLEWCTPSQNAHHAFRLNLRKPSEKQKKATTKNWKKKRTVSDEVVVAIRNEYMPHKITMPMLAEKYNISRSLVCSIVHGNSYRDLLQEVKDKQ